MDGNAGSNAKLDGVSFEGLSWFLQTNVDYTIKEGISIMTSNSKVLRAGIAALAATTLSVISSFAYAAADPAVRATHQIVESIGLKGCKIGDDDAAFQRLFGGTSANGHLISEAKGVEAATTHGKIVSLIFHFSSSSFGVFDGETLMGIGRQSSPEDVIRTYGKPESLQDGPGPLTSATSWKQELSIRYWSKGLTFTFWDGRLADIRVYQVKSIE
ncbi:MAG: hypothetical protein ABIZ09_08640 [Rhodoferax sp.]